MFDNPFSKTPVQISPFGFPSEDQPIWRYLYDLQKHILLRERFLVYALLIYHSYRFRTSISDSFINDSIMWQSRGYGGRDDVARVLSFCSKLTSLKPRPRRSSAILKRRMNATQQILPPRVPYRRHEIWDHPCRRSCLLIDTAGGGFTVEPNVRCERSPPCLSYLLPPLTALAPTKNDRQVGVITLQGWSPGRGITTTQPTRQLRRTNTPGFPSSTCLA